MRYKWIGLAACAATLLIAIAAPLFFTNEDRVARVHQHEQKIPDYKCTDPDDGGLCTYLPIVEINTNGTEIPGRPVSGNTGNLHYTMAANGESTIAADMKIIGEDTNEYHHANGVSDLSSRIRIRIRGNSSRHFDKPSYAIRLVDEEDRNAPASIMGMKKHHEWVLYGPWLDKTAVRNYMFYNLAGEMMDYAPNVRYCEVILNGEYQGLYVMTESITAGKDGARLALTVNSKKHEYTGYLLRLDHKNQDNEALNSFTTYTYTTPLELQIEFPGQKNQDEELVENIRQDFSDFEKSLYSFDYDKKQYGYKSQIDVNSFVDYFIINELTSNADAGNYSTYMYKGTDHLFHMCVWDFNNACDNYFEEEISNKGFFMQNRLWYWMLMKDEDFVEQIIYRYHELRKDILSEEALDNYIDEAEKFLAPALIRNDKRWGDVSQQANLLNPAERNLTSRSAAEGQLKGYLHNRGEWLDANIEILRQYCADSKVKEYNEVND